MQSRIGSEDSGVLTLFHTADSNAALFGAIAESAGVKVRHVVRADLLAAAEAAGELSPAVRKAAVDSLRTAAGRGPVVCTCSTLGPAADDLADAGLAVRRVDRLLAERAVAGGGRIAVLYAVATTEGPTRELFERSARDSGAGAAIEMRLVSGAWDRFREGDAQGYARLIADAVGGLDDGYAAVALAQASMAPAAALCERPVLTSPGVLFG